MSNLDKIVNNGINLHKSIAMGLCDGETYTDAKPAKAAPASPPEPEPIRVKAHIRQRPGASAA